MEDDMGKLVVTAVNSAGKVVEHIELTWSK